MTEYYSAIKRNEILIQAIMWVNLTDITLSERSQSQKENIVWLHSREILG